MIERGVRKGNTSLRAPSILILIVFLTVSCKDDPKFSSMEGDWTYNTPDGKIGVDFTLVMDGSKLKLVNESIRVDGTTYVAAAIYTPATSPSFGALHINANDSKAVYAYYLEVPAATANDTFTEIKGPSATYTWPHNKTNQLTDIVIVRK